MLAQAMAARGRPFAQPTAYDTFKAAMGYNLRDVVTEISTPVLITNPDDETFWPGQSQSLYDNLTGEREITHFLREDGANFHCEPMGRAETESRIFDFLHDQLDRSPVGWQASPSPPPPVRLVDPRPSSWSSWGS